MVRPAGTLFVLCHQVCHIEVVKVVKVVKDNMTVSPVGRSKELWGQKTMVRIQVRSGVNVEDQVIHTSLLQQVQLVCVRVFVVKYHIYFSAKGSR